MPDGKSQITPKISGIIKNLFSFFKIKNQQNSQNTEEELKDIITEDFNNHSLRYENMTAEDIMIPRVDIVAIEYNSSLKEITSKFIANRHTRMPVYKNDLDNVTGYINIKDILPFVFDSKNKSNFNIESVMRKLLVIPPSIKIFNLLEKMRQDKTHIALVVDELGSADGLITIEDLIEEIIGEIEDEHDQENIQFQKINNKTYEVSGRIEIQEIQEKLGINLSSAELEEEYDTISGLILSISSYVPNKGDKIIHPSTNIVFEIVDSDLRRIKTVRIHLP